MYVLNDLDRTANKFPFGDIAKAPVPERDREVEILSVELAVVRGRKYMHMYMCSSISQYTINC